MTLQGITPMLAVASVADSVAFYTEQLGFECTDQMGDDGGQLFWARVARDGKGIMLALGHDHDDEGNDIPLQRDAHGHRDVILYLYVDDVAALRDELLAAGLEVGEPYDTDYGLREIHLNDPDGFPILCGQPLSSPPQ